MAVTLNPGLCSVTFRRLEPQQVVDLAVEAGLAAIEWGGDVHVPPDDLPRAAAIGEMTRAAGLNVSSYGSYLRPPQDGADDFLHVAETARALGAPMIRIWPGVHKKPSSDYSERERAAATRAIAAMGRLAADEGVAIGLEYHPNTLTDELASARRLIREVDCEAVQLYWQPRPGLPLEECQREISALGDHIAHIHVFQWNARTERFPLEDGAAVWRDLLAAVPPSRWQGRRYAMLEFVRDDDPSQFRRDAATLKGLLAEIEGAA